MLRSEYDACVLEVDGFIGHFLDRLKELGLYDQSLIVLFADHGEGLFDHGLCQHLASHYDEVVRVPLLIKLPHGRKGGLRVKPQVRTIDIFPTMLELAGIQAQDAVRLQVHGVSLVPLLENKELELDACVETRHLPVHTDSIRSHDGWKLIVNRLDDSRELFDLAADPAERKNIFFKQPETAGRMEEALLGCLGYSTR